MCISAGPEAKFTGTRIYVGEATLNGQYVHVLAYQNEADSPGPNAMILPIPSSEDMGPENIIDTRRFPSFLKDIADASKLRSFRKSVMLNENKGCAAGIDSLAQVFDIGSYTVVLATKASQIPEALSRVPEDRRPTVSVNFLLGLSKLYRDHKIAICCWAGGKIQAEPILWWYVPTNRDVLFIPTMDAHDGNAPDVSASVDTDHIISVGSTLAESRGQTGKVQYTETLPSQVRDLLPTNVNGTRLSSRMKNGDGWVNTTSLLKEIPLLKRGMSVNVVEDTSLMAGWVAY